MPETTASSLSIDDAARQYLGTLSARAYQEQAPEIHRFSRWFTGTRPLTDLRVPEVERYVENVNKSTDAESHLKALRPFLTYLKKSDLIADNLAPLARPRRTGGGSGGTISEERLDVTAEGLAALRHELEGLIGQRPQIAEALRAAMADKDFRENAPLDAAREHQAHVEARIRELEAMLKRAVVVENAGGGQVIRLGSKVRLRDLQTGREVRYVLVGPGEVNAGEGRISASSPVGRALLDRGTGEEVEVSAPAKTFRFKIEEIEA